MDRTGLGVLGASLVGVIAASTLTPPVGACGTAHYFLLHALTATVRQELGMVGFGRQAVFIALNTAVFAIPAGLLYLNRASLGGRYRLAVCAWTAIFLLSYFFAVPTADCP